MIQNSYSYPATYYTLVYATLMMCFVFRNKDFISAGFAIENIFDWLLKREHEDFILYHIKRTSITIFVHSFLPLLYLIGLGFVTEDYNLIITLDGLWWTTFVLFAHIFPLTSASVILFWAQNNWERHPIARTLQLYCTDETSWRQFACTVNADYRGFDKINLETSSLARIIVTNNWIIKITPYKMELAHQSDSSLVVSSADTHQISIEGEGAVQYVNIEVKSSRPGVPSFFIRCKSIDFNDLKHKIIRPIQILEGVTFHKTRIDHFVEVFREMVEKNPSSTLAADQELDNCIGCMLSESQVTLVKRCSQSQCTSCYCRPLWCLNCMATWFASRQDQERPETWLSSTCTCPVCRSVFCILDVCLIRK